MTARATAARLVTSVPLLWVSVAAVTFLAIGLMFRRSQPTVLLPRAIQAQIDQIEATRTRDRGSIGSLRISAAAAQERGHSLVEHAEGVVTRSRTDAHRSDSLAAEARRQALNADSAMRVAELYRQAYESRTLEAEELGKAIDTLLRAHREDSRAIALNKGVALIIATRLATIERVFG